ncbi:MAG: FAD-dependent oxidoreductase [SAR324 cluster bacterium]|nr:FAD-dependent oxidoreductase [SAR324 cluster bacterium]
MDKKIKHFDIAVIGSGPAGEKAAMQASKLRKSVILIEKDPVHIGGSSLHTGTIPSKSLRETVVYLELLRKRAHGVTISFKENLTANELMKHKDWVIEDQEGSFRRNLKKTGVELLHGTPQFQPDSEQVGLEEEITPGKPAEKSSKSPVNKIKGSAVFKSPKLIEIDTGGEEPIHITADYTVIATGSRPHRPSWAKFDGVNVFDSDTILQIKNLPKKLTIVGAGVIGCEYACIFAKLGIRVNLVSKDYNILPFIDHEIADMLKERMRESRITLRFGEEMEAIRVTSKDCVEVQLKSGKILPCSSVMVAAGRSSNTVGLGLEAIGVKLGNRGLVEVNRETYQTSVENIYAVGDVIGFPGLASTAMLQARIAILHAFGGLENERLPENLAFGIWTIPAIGMVGKTEQQLTDAKIPYEVGIGHFSEVSRARIMGEHNGILKLLFDPKTLKLLGVHAIGPSAMEMIHLGQSVLFFGGTIKYFMNSVFNYPTLDQVYQVAAFNGINRLTFDL